MNEIDLDPECELLRPLENTMQKYEKAANENYPLNSESSDTEDEILDKGIYLQ